MNKKYSNNIEEMLVKGVLSLFMITLNINLLYTHLNWEIMWEKVCASFH